MRCVSRCTASAYQLQKINQHFKNQGYQTKAYRNKVLHIPFRDGDKHAFVFFNGCFVTWGLTRRMEENLLEQLTPFAIEPSDKPEANYFSYHYADETAISPLNRFNIDIITLEHNADVDIKLAVSYGLEQSIELEFFEASIQRTIKKYSTLPEKLAQTGKISLSKKTLLKITGELFKAKSSINLNSEYLDVPDYFWDNSNVEKYYTMCLRFFDIRLRAQALNQRLSVLQELFDMLSNQVQYKHDTSLEWIIIFLIFAELVLMLVFLK
jgi:uncharacterized Rmd1/YagE family protein